MISLIFRPNLLTLRARAVSNSDRAQEEEVSPAGDPKTANIVAAALFQLGRYPDCLRCEALTPSLEGDVSFGFNAWRFTTQNWTPR